MRKILLTIMTAGLLTIPATADRMSVPFTARDAPLSFLFPDGGGDTLDLTGHNGFVTLARDAVTKASIFNSRDTTVWTSGSGVRTFDLIYEVTLDGVTHTRSQPVVWAIMFDVNVLKPGQGMSPATFRTPTRTWSMTSGAFTSNHDLQLDVTSDALPSDHGVPEDVIPSTIQTDLAPVPNTIPSVPEPATMGMLSAGLGALVVLRRKQPVLLG